MAIKFVKKENLEQIEREYKIYSYLDAIENPDVEKYGIPTAYGYNEWQHCVYMAISLFEFDLIDAVRKGSFNYTLHDNHKALNSLILFKDFVSAFDCNFMFIFNFIIYIDLNFIFEVTTIEIHA